jgi:hypothetical protein
MSYLAVITGCALVWACADSRSPSSDADAGLDSSMVDGSADGSADPATSCDCSDADRPVDILIVMEQQSDLTGLLVERVTPNLGRVIGGHFSNDARSVHVGLLSADVGIGHDKLRHCTVEGDRGVLHGPREAELCAEPGNVLSSDTATDVERLSQELDCRLFTDDCGFEQHLESMLTAITPSEAQFPHGPGQADLGNAGFLRPDSHLVVVVVAGEDDCSAEDRGLYDPDSSEFTADLIYRCFRYPDALHPVSRYVDGLLEVRPASRLGFVLLAGVPVDLEGASTEAILADERMQAVADSEAPRQRPSCGSIDGVYAPPRRLVSLTGELREAGSNVAIVSMCQLPDRRTERLDRVFGQTTCSCEGG